MSLVCIGAVCIILQNAGHENGYLFLRIELFLAHGGCSGPRGPLTRVTTFVISNSYIVHFTRDFQAGVEVAWGLVKKLL